MRTNLQASQGYYPKKHHANTSLSRLNHKSVDEQPHRWHKIPLKSWGSHEKEILLVPIPQKTALLLSSYPGIALDVVLLTPK